MRITLDVSRDVERRLKRIQERMEVKSNGEVIARALVLYEFLTDKVADDHKVMIVDDKGEAEEVEIR